MSALTMQQEWLEHRRELDALVRQATRALLDIADANPSMALADFQFYYGALIDQYGVAATESALIALENSRKIAGVWSELAVPTSGAMPPAGQIAGTFSWAASSAEEIDVPRIARTLAGPLGRLIKQPGRDTIWESTRSAGTRYARVPGPRACHFCLMLASRGAVYTRQSALAVTSRSASDTSTHFRNRSAGSGHTFTRGRPEGSKFHDNCTCTAIESLTDSDLPKVVRDLQDEWYEVTWDDRGPVKAQAAVWREHIRKTRPNGETVRPKET